MGIGLRLLLQLDVLVFEDAGMDGNGSLSHWLAPFNSSRASTRTAAETTSYARIR